MNNFLETLENCREFLRANPNVKDAFENMDVSSCPGFEYTLNSGVAIKLRVDMSINYVVMHAHFGVTVRKEYQSMVAEYCQRMTDFLSVNYLAVEPDQGHVYCHIESSFQDNPVSVALLEQMESTVARMLEKHSPVIECLAYGRLPNENDYPVAMMDEAGRVLTSEEQSLLDSDIAAIRDYLANSGHNIIGENLDPNHFTRFFSETITSDTRFRDWIHVLQNGWLVRTMRLEIRCNDEFRTQLAQLCNFVTDEKKVGYMTIGEDGYPYCTVSSYLLDGQMSVSSEMLESMEKIAVAFLHSSERNLRYVGSGVLPPEAFGEDGFLSKRRRKAIPRVMESPHARHNSGISSPQSLHETLLAMHAAQMSRDAAKKDDDEDSDLAALLMDLIPDIESDEESVG